MRTGEYINRLRIRIDDAVCVLAAGASKYWMAVILLFVNALLSGIAWARVWGPETGGHARAAWIVYTGILALAGYAAMWGAWAWGVSRWARTRIEHVRVIQWDPSSFIPIGIGLLIHTHSIEGGVTRTGTGLLIPLLLGLLIKAGLLFEGWRSKQRDELSRIREVRNRLMHADPVPADAWVSGLRSQDSSLCTKKYNVGGELRNAVHLKGAQKGVLKMPDAADKGMLPYAVGVRQNRRETGALRMAFGNAAPEDLFFNKSNRALLPGWNNFMADPRDSGSGHIHYETTAHADFYFSLERSNLSRSTGNAKTRNVVVVVLDAVPREALSLYTDVVDTRAISEYFEHGIVYDNAYAQSEWTLPAAASMALSLYSTHHGVHDPDYYMRPMPSNLSTMAELCQAAGCRTLAYTGGWRVSPGLGHARGYDRFIYRSPRFQPEAYRMEDITLAAIDHLKEYSNESSFIYLHYMDTHAPFFQSVKHRYTRQGSVSDISLRDLDLKTAWSDSEKELFREMFCQKMLEADRSLSLLFDYVHNHATETAIILTADHGSTYLDHGLTDLLRPRTKDGRSRYLAESVVRVPLLIRPPAITGMRSRRVSDPVEACTGLMPTVLGLMGIPMPDDRDGRDLLAVGRDGRVGDGYALSESIYKDIYEIMVRDHQYEFFCRANRDRATGRLGPILHQAITCNETHGLCPAEDEMAFMAEAERVLEEKRIPFRITEHAGSV